MLHIFLGTDEFSMEEAIGDLKSLIDSPELMDANIMRTKASDTSPGELYAISNTMPFMASRRLVIVEGLIEVLSKISNNKQEKGTGVSNPSDWSAFIEALEILPETTELVIVDVDDGKRRNNPWLQRLSKIGTVKRFDELLSRDLHKWITERAVRKDLKISRGGILLLSDMIGPNLRLLDNELEKLSLYANGEFLTEEQIRLLVVHVREMSIFEVVDSMLESRFDDALKALANLHKKDSVGNVISMLSRQIRLILIAKDLHTQGLKIQEIGERIGITSRFLLDKLRKQSSRYSYQKMKGLHSGLLDLDLAIKTGRTKENSVDGVLVQIFRETLHIDSLA